MPPSMDLKTGVHQKRAIHNLVQVFIGLLAPDGALLDANQSALNFAGVDLDKVVGTPFWETPWWRDCQESQDALKDAIKRGASGEASRFEAQHTGKKGDTIDVDFSLTPIFDDAGRVVR